MRVIAKYKSVEVIYPNGATEVVKCHSVHDALEFRSRLLNVLPYRERATKDSGYLKDFYVYLKNKGIIEKDAFIKAQSLLNKARLCEVISQNWL